MLRGAEHVHCACIAHAPAHAHVVHMQEGLVGSGAGWAGGKGAECRLLHFSSKSPPCTSWSSAHRRGTAPGSSGPPHASLPSTFRVYVRHRRRGRAALPAGAPG